MKLIPIQTSFAAGEISPLLLARSDSDGYKSGLLKMTNMLPDSRGPAVSRFGYGYIGEADYNHGRVFPLISEPGYVYLLTFFENVISMFSAYGSGPAVPYNTNANFDNGSLGWNTFPGDGLIQFFEGQCSLEITKGGTGSTVRISQQTAVPLEEVKLAVSLESSNTDVIIKVGTTENGEDVYSGLLSQLDGAVTFTPTATEIWVTLEVVENNIEDVFVIINSVYLLNPDSTGTIFAAPYLGYELDDIHLTSNPSGNTVYVFHPNHPPYQLTYDSATDVFTWDLVIFTSQPAEWTTGNYPSTGDFFEGRLWVGGVNSHRQTFWASKSGAALDFTLGELDDDAIKFVLAKHGRIVWIKGFKNLLIGTGNGEHVLSSEGGYLSPSDIQVTQQSSYGSANVQPVQVGDQIFYVSTDRKKLRAVQYEWRADNWLSTDLTFVSEHITESGIRHMAWVQNPSNQFVCVLMNGDQAIMSYDRGSNVYGWSLHQTDGSIRDVCSVDEDGSDVDYSLIRRKDGVINLERRSTFGKARYVDSYVAVTTIFVNPGEEGGFIISGLDPLEGKECQVTIDGAVHSNRTVVDGSIVVDWLGRDIAVGLPFLRTMWTMPIDNGSQIGSGAPFIKRYNKHHIRIHESPKPLINGVRAPERHPITDMNVVEPFVTEDIMTPILGHNNTSIVTIEQDLPLPLTVLGTFGELVQDIV